MSQDTPAIHCNFCDKLSTESRKTISGISAHICDECVDLCYDILDSTLAQQAMEDMKASGSSPKAIFDELSKHVVGQDQAKKILSVAAYNHMKRVQGPGAFGGVEVQKANVLLLGGTGTGKTFLVQALSKILNIPLATADANAITQAGYVGEDVEDMLSRLLQDAGGDVYLAQQGIIYIDEVDKIAATSSGKENDRDVSGKGVQQALLRMIEGAVVQIQPDNSSKSGGSSRGKSSIDFDTTDVLFIFGGAFEELERSMAKKLDKGSSIGFGADVRNEQERATRDLVYHSITPQDLVAAGMIPELMGRIPIVAPLEQMTIDSLVRILTEPTNCLVDQYTALLAVDEIKLEFEIEGLQAIAERALERKSGARSLRAIMEEVLLDTMFTALDHKKPPVKVVITRGVVEGLEQPKVTRIKESELPKRVIASEANVISIK